MSMAAPLLLVITGIFSMLGLGAAYFLMFPVFLRIQANPSADCLASANCIAVFNRSYDAMFALFEVFTGGIFLVLYMRALRRDTGAESYQSSGFESF